MHANTLRQLPFLRLISSSICPKAALSIDIARQGHICHLSREHLQLCTTSTVQRINPQNTPRSASKENMAPRTSKVPRDKKSAGRSKPKELFPMINWIYDLLLWTFSVLVDLFFREVHPRGSWKIPRRGPIIFVAAPHANQVCPSPNPSKLVLK